MNLIQCHCIYFKYGGSDFFFFWISCSVAAWLSSTPWAAAHQFLCLWNFYGLNTGVADIPFWGISGPRGQSDLLHCRFFASEAPGHPNNQTEVRLRRTLNQIKLNKATPLSFIFVMLYCFQSTIISITFICDCKEKQVIIAHSTDKKTEAQMDKKRTCPRSQGYRAVWSWGTVLARGWLPQDSPKAHHVAHHGSSQVVPTGTPMTQLCKKALILPIFNAPSLTRPPR